ncbi:hypothetical protein B0H11DRAFT_2244665 [Mycena galericulata]|nr:hypothetical protein B0H11DRAFT_2244665 [Mycena galericulata]
MADETPSHLGFSGPNDCGARFSHSRQACLSGYLDVPHIFTAMSFDLIHLPRITSRTVRLQNRVLELWSPNSLQLPFLPGFRLLNYLPSMPLQPTGRRYDGHAGKHDCLYAPQYYRGATAHWPFMRRVASVAETESAAVAFAPLSKYWVSTKPGTTEGHLDPEFVSRLSAFKRELDDRARPFRRSLGGNSATWDARPKAGSDAAITALLGLRSWDGAVDSGVTVQRGLRELEGWITWMATRFHQDGWTPNQFKWMSMPLANDDLIGLWINGMKEEIVMRYMAAGVPCFLVHEYHVDAIPRPGPVFGSLLEGTELELLLSDLNPYQRIARLQEGRLDSMPSVLDGRGLAPVTIAVDEMRSSSQYLEALTRSAPPPAESSATQATVPLPERGQNRYEHRKIETRTIDPDRVNWVVPPPVHKARDDKKKWTKWELDDYEGVTAFVYRGKAKEIEAANEWYDRENKRRLFFGHLELDPGVLDAEVFGAPAPQFPFITDEGNRGVPARPSYWMYPREMPSRSDVDREAQRPEPLRLPLLRGARQEAQSEAAEEESRNKGKGKAPARGEEVVAELTEGLPEDYEELYEGMEVEPQRPEETPSNVVVIRGLDSNISATMFRAMSRDALYSSNAQPEAIFQGQGMMWTRFTSRDDGLRSFGALSQLGRRSSGEQISAFFSTDAEFEEAMRYTTDRWTRESERDEGTGIREGEETMLVDDPSSTTSSTTGERSSATIVGDERPSAAPDMDEEMAPVENERTVAEETGNVTMDEDEPIIIRGRSLSLPSPPRPMLVQVIPPVVSTAEIATPATTLVSPISPPNPPSNTLQPVAAAPRAPPTEPRAMRERRAELARRPLVDRLSAGPNHRPWASQGGSAGASYAKKAKPSLSSPARGSNPALAKRLSSSAQSSTPALAQRLSSPTPPSLARRLASAPYPSLRPQPSAPPSPSPPPSSALEEDAEDAEKPKKKARRGKRSGRIVKEIQARREQRAAARTEESAVTEEAGTVKEATDANVEEAVESEDDEEKPAPKWADDENDDPPVAGPSHL